MKIRFTEFVKDKYYDYVTNKEFNQKDPHYMGEVSDDIADELYEFFTHLIQELDICEKWTSDNNLSSHFEKHCLSNKNKSSNHNNIRYDFTTIEDYKAYESKISDIVLNSSCTVESLYDTEAVLSALNAVSNTATSIRFSNSCDLKNNNGKVQIGLNSFANDVTTNFPSANTINLLVLSAAGYTISMYAIDVNIVKNKFRDIINRYSNNKHIRKLYKDLL